jgi:hypothetical protein
MARPGGSKPAAGNAPAQRTSAGETSLPGSSIELSFTAEPLAVVHFVIVATETTGEQMFVRLLEPGCTESPACQCGAEMKIATIETLPEGTDAAVRVYRCSACHREMRLTVWAAITPPTDEDVSSI